MLRRLRPTALLLTSVALLSYAAADAATDDAAPCAGQQNAVVIDASAHRLWLCAGEKVAREFTVSLGQGGLGKQRTGDNRTPLGWFALGSPRPSAEFSLFIPVGYPNPEQKKVGFTGSDIGIHGPKKGWRWLGRFATWSDWTRGCIAVSRESEIAEIAAWVSSHGTSRVHIFATAKP